MPSGPTLSDSVSAEIRIELARQGISQSALARRCGWIPQYLRRRMVGDVPWTLEDLDAIAQQLGIERDALMNPVQR